MSHIHEKEILAFEKWFLKAFPQHCQKLSYENESIDLNGRPEFNLSTDNTGLTLPGKNIEAFNLESCDIIRLNKRLIPGIYRARFSVSDICSLMDISENDRKDIFHKFIYNIENNKLHSINIVKGSFFTPGRDQIVIQCEDPRYIELRYYFKY